MKAGAADAPEMLGRPVKDTLFFAGEAADVTGNNGTVHGAIARSAASVAEITKSGNRPPTDPRLPIGFKDPVKADSKRTDVPAPLA